jgi:Ca2+-binding EF-hand superfamily protein
MHALLLAAVMTAVLLVRVGGDMPLSEAAMQDKTSKSSVDWNVLFPIIDKDRNSVLSQSEVMQFMQERHYFLASQNAQKLISLKNLINVMRNEFVACDTNRDGSIQYLEGVEKYGWAPDREDPGGRQPHKEMDPRANIETNEARDWNFADRNQDTELDFHEFLVLHHPELSSNTTGLLKVVCQNMIATYDTNGDGLMSTQEIQDASSTEKPMFFTKEVLTARDATSFVRAVLCACALCARARSRMLTRLRARASSAWAMRWLLYPAEPVSVCLLLHSRAAHVRRFHSAHTALDHPSTPLRCASRCPALPAPPRLPHLPSFLRPPNQHTHAHTPPSPTPRPPHRTPPPRSSPASPRRTARTSVPAL